MAPQEHNIVPAVAENRHISVRESAADCGCNVIAAAQNANVLKP